MNFRKHVPDLFTALNLLAGCFGIVALFEGKPAVASSLIIVGAIFDFFDGFFARLLKAGSPLGKELDSLADLITFGLLPAFLVFYILRENSDGYYPYISFILVVAAAFRLARFNLDSGQKDDFTGLPTPANAFFFAGLVNIYLVEWRSFMFFFDEPNLLAVVVILLSYLMVSDIRFLSLKFPTIRWRENIYRYMVITAGLILIIFLRMEGIFFAILFYMILSIYRHFALLLKARQG
jgi:CDP-diacylglycerol---serine O-phosphatidyltransferase